jgi:hypothetical protein
VSTPLANEQITDLRRDVESGKRRRVVLLTDSAGLPAGKAGEVTRVGTPDSDGSDFIGVRIGGDELFFSPAELGLGGGRKVAAPEKAPDQAPAKAQARRAPAQRAPQADASAPAKAAPVKTAAKAAESAPAKQAAARTTESAPAKQAAAGTTESAPAKQAAARTTESAPVKQAAKKSPAPAKAPVKAAARPGRKPPKTPSVAITIRSTDAGWSVEAHRGGKVVLKATPVRAGTVQEVADAVDEDAITAIVREVLDLRRSVAESEAEELREALARAEAVLAEYDAGH